VNLPQKKVSRQDAATITPEEATLCDICLAVGRAKELFDREEVQKLASLVAKYKRLIQ